MDEIEVLLAGSVQIREGVDTDTGALRGVEL